MSAEEPMDVEAEIRELKHRVSQLEGSFGFLSDQIKGVHKDLLAFQKTTTLFQKTTTLEFKTIREEFSEAKKATGLQFQSLRDELKSLRRDLSDIVAKAVGPLLRR